MSAYYIQNAAAQSGTQTWTFSKTGFGGGVFEEFSGGATTGLLGNYVIHTGTSSTIASGSLTDTNSSELLICFGGVFLGYGTDTFSSPTNSFILATNAQGSNDNEAVQEGEAGFMTYQILTTSGGPYSTSITSSSSGGYATILANFVP